MNTEKIKKVHIVFKTHLDIGFTDMAQTVLDCYMDKYIPRALLLAKRLNTGENKKFIWTVGSYLIDYCRKYGTEEQRSALDHAIREGDICWHGIACTTHTELLDMDLFRYSLDIGKKLDEQFGKKTIAAKMTDVPGHTIAIVDALAERGIGFLHIGVNGGSMVPEVPGTFVWRHGGKSIIVQYSSEYGAAGYVEGMDEVLEFAHTADNMGPQSEGEIEREIERIGRIYPGAAVEASTLDHYARSLRKIKNTLPVIQEEIGDTWIYGIASDPWKTGRYRELIRLKDQWKEEKRFDETTPGYHDFMTHLMLIAEHTWGLDYKKYLADFRNWSKEDFSKARMEDRTSLELLTNRNAQLKELLEKEIQSYRQGIFSGSYSHYESSHEEQRQYLKKAIEKLPEDLKEQALEAMRKMSPVLCSEEGEILYPGKETEIQGWKVQVGNTGALVRLEKDSKDWAKDGEIGIFSYETFNALNCVNDYYRYSRDFYRNGCWSEADLSKPGLEFVEDLEHRNYEFFVQSIRKGKDRLTIDLGAWENAKKRYGCPGKAQIIYTFTDEKININLAWFEKDANRMPEAMWFGFRLHTENPNRWKMLKMGTEVHPLNVVRGGNRLQHCAPVLRYEGADGKALIRSIHAPLVSTGGRNLYGDYHAMPGLEQGFAFNLFNNKWGTNFKMWCEDNCRFDFELQLEAY